MMKRFIIVFTIFIIILASSFVFPIKSTLSIYPQNSNDFLIVRYDSNKNWWLVVGDKNGLWDWNTISDYPVTIEGKNIETIISSDIYQNFMPTTFVLWGQVNVSEDHHTINGQKIVISRRYSIQCTDWDIYGEVHSLNDFRMKFCTKYLTIYDFKWFDDFRYFVGLKDD